MNLYQDRGKELVPFSKIDANLLAYTFNLMFVEGNEVLGGEGERLKETKYLT
jgi:hypothetical protein